MNERDGFTTKRRAPHRLRALRFIKSRMVVIYTG